MTRFPICRQDAQAMSEFTLNNFVASNSPLHESLHQIDMPQSENMRALVTIWENRPPDGLVVGRDIPSRAIARVLSHILLWEPIEDGVDLVLRLCGEGMRLRFGADAVGKRFSELIAPEVVPFFRDLGKRMLDEERCASFDIRLKRRVAVDGRNELHFELVIFPVWSPDRKARWFLNGISYFL
jgi:hypothetical protein